MKILHVSYSDGRGGAAQAAHRIHRSLLSRGLLSSMAVMDRTREEPEIFGPPSSLHRKTHAILDHLPHVLSGNRDFPFRSTAWTGSHASTVARRLKPDIIQLGWIGGGILRIEDLPRFQAPLVWRLSDMWAFSGGEHYTRHLSRIRDGYSRKNRPAESRGWDVDRWVWTRKRRTYPKIRSLTIVAPSHWMAEISRNSLLLNNRRTVVIPTGVDTGVFVPGDQSQLRHALGLPPDRRLILYGAMDALTDPRKGFEFLRTALERISGPGHPPAELVVFGGPPLEMAASLRIHNRGRITDRKELAALYAACDCFVVPSQEENLANTALESLACGTPVVSFDVGGMADAVRHLQTGYLAAPGDAGDMARGIVWVMTERERSDTLSANARALALKSFSLESQSAAFENLYRELLEESSR
ncbi:MAG: glycosyltransferase [Verrucomicrobiae bacterium]|nr:glycosyltransferase [Verrucomicrobiae bacterium]